MIEHSVVIAGGGPTGLMLAGELALADVDVAVVERRSDQELSGSRALGMHTRTIEVLDQRGIADRFVSQGQRYPVVHFHIALDTSDLPTRHNYTLGLWQKHTERILAEWIGELPVTMYRGRDVTGFTQDEAGVVVQTSDGESLRAEYLVGCDGGRSVIRKTAGIDFPGWDPSMSWLMAEIDTSEEPKLGFHENAFGIHAIGKGEDGVTRVVLAEQPARVDSEPTFQDVSETLIKLYGTDYGLHSARWISRFSDMARQAAAYRVRRVFLAGDAAHVHAPLGGQGLNLGVQDAVNLGWKLAQVIKKLSPDSLLDTYHAERHPVGARVLRTTMAHVAVRRTDDRSKALGEIVSELLRMDAPRKRVAAEMVGLAIHYDLGEGHPLVGRRMPDLHLLVADASVRVFTFLHHARPVLINFGEPGSIDIGAWADRVQSVDAKYEGTWELPVIGVVDPPSAVLIRPDGYVAWVGDGTSVGLVEALTTWFGG